MRAATSDTPQRAPAIIISVLCAVIYSEPLCGWLAACRFSAPPPLSLCQSLLACLAGWLLVHVRDVIHMCCGAVYGKSINKDVITWCVPRREHAQWPQPERDRNGDRQTAKRQQQQRQRQRRKTPAGNAAATLRVAVSFSTCVHDVTVVGTRALSLSFALARSRSISVAISFQLTSLGSEYC